MTFFINEPTEAPKIKAKNPNIDLAGGWFDTVGAAVTSAQLENDANFIGRRTTIETKAAKGWDLADRIGSEAIEKRARERGLPDGMVSTFSVMMKRKPPNMPAEMQGIIFDLAQEAATDDPQAWADVDFSDEAVLKEANDKLQAEHQEAQDILAMSPGGETAARFIGGMIGITADIKNAPFLLLGGGQGSILRVMGREAMLNMAAETAFLPSQFEMAERLDIPDPNVPQQLALAAAAGGILGGIVEAGSRGVTYFRLRNRTAQIPGYDPLTSQAMVDEVEDILTSDTPRPFEKIQQLQEETPQAPYRLENPLNPQRPPLIEDPATAPIAGPGEAETPTVTTTPLDPVDGGQREPLTDENLIETMRTAIEGDSSWLRSRAEVQRLEAELEAYQRDGDSSPTDDFIAGSREDSGFFVDLDDYEFQHGQFARQRIADDLNAYLDETGQTFLTDAERAEILEELQSRGGDAEYLVERIAEREIELSTAPQPEDALDDIPFGDDATTAQGDVGSGRGGSERSSGNDGSEGPGGARTEDPGSTRTEQTDAGEQIVAPGIEPISQRQRLETQQGAPLRGGDAAADIGLFDTGARAQMDIFDNPAGTEARAIQDSITNDILTDIEANGPTEVNIALEDGRVLKTDQDVLTYLDEGDAFSARIDLCGKGPT